MSSNQLRLLLSKYRYYPEDRHLDVIVQLVDNTSPDKGNGRLRLVYSSSADQTPAYEAEFTVPSPRFVCYPPLPTKEGKWQLQLEWTVGGELIGRANADFVVAAATPVEREGRIPVMVPNPPGLTVAGFPQTVGVPFPRGALDEETQLRLVTAEGREVPLQTKLLSRWSKYGSIRWLLCDFSVDLQGKPLELFLEYGPKVARSTAPALRVEGRGDGYGFPSVDAGRLKIGPEGLEWKGGKEPVRLLSGGVDGGLGTPYVQRENGEFYAPSPKERWKIEEQGDRKLVLRRSGWYVDEANPQSKFCQYVTRYWISRDSPVLRVFHTWIYTGDSNHDRIREMGWKFPLTPDTRPAGLLESFAQDARWLEADYLVQYDSDEAGLGRKDGTVEKLPIRAPGVAAATAPSARLYLGVKDFWQNYPREIGFEPGLLVFNEWPAHGRAHSHPVEENENLMRLWFAHEGSLLDFRLPDAYGEDPIYSKIRHEQYWPKGDTGAVNAQGVAKTSEFWIYLTNGESSPSEAEGVLEALDAETLRAVVDPAWVAASGAFFEVHPLDTENFPREEAVYALQAHAPMRWVERMKMYGKWIWGNMLWTPNLEGQTAGLYRGLRKAHQGWPYSWLPYARSGNPAYLKFAEAATREMTDVCFNHYHDEKTGNRQRGEWYRGALPWTGSGAMVRDYAEKSDYKLHAYYLTGYQRAYDVLEDWAGLVKEAFARDGLVALQGPRAPRRATNLLKTYVDTYQATFDPWFILAAQVLAQRGEPWDSYRDHFWQPGNREYLRFTGNPEFERYYLDEYAPKWSDPLSSGGGWVAVAPQIEQPAFAYQLTGKEEYLRRVEGWLDWTDEATYAGEPDYYKGWTLSHMGNNAVNYTGYYLQQFPFALAALAKANQAPLPLRTAFFQAPAQVAKEGKGIYRWKLPVVAVHKKEGEALPLRLAINVGARTAPDQKFSYTLTGPEGENVAEGDWAIANETTVEIPQQHPAGTYRLLVEGITSLPLLHPTGEPKGMLTMPALRVPLSPPGTPEVLELGPEEELGPAFWQVGYYVQVPEACDSFQVTFEVQSQGRGPKEWKGLGLIRLGVWNPKGELVWKDEHLLSTQKEPSVTATLAVAPEEQGKLWKITAPGWSRGLKLGPELPPIVAVGPERWFNSRKK